MPPIRRLASRLLAAGCTCLLCLATLQGCGPGDENDRAFLNEVGPGKPPENPDEEYAARKNRVNTKTPGVPEKKTRGGGR